MKNIKRTWQQKFATALAIRGIKFKMDSSMLSTEYGELIFEPQRLCIRYSGHAGINAKFRYNDTPDIGQIIKLLTNMPSVQKSIEVKPIKTRATWKWVMIGFLFIASCAYAAIRINVSGQFIEVQDETGSHSIPMSAQINRMTKHDETLKGGAIKELNVNTDLTAAVNQMAYYASINQPNKPLSYTFEKGSWLHENLTHISKLSRHQIIYDTNTNFRINYKIIESGRGSDIARKAFHAINSQFEGQLMLVQCKNTSIITDKEVYAGLCS